MGFPRLKMTKLLSLNYFQYINYDHNLFKKDNSKNHLEAYPSKTKSKWKVNLQKCSRLQNYHATEKNHMQEGTTCITFMRVDK